MSSEGKVPLLQVKPAQIIATRFEDCTTLGVGGASGVRDGVTAICKVTKSSCSYS